MRRGNPAKLEVRCLPFLVVFLQKGNLLLEDGKLRQPNSIAKERLLDFVLRHTCTCMLTRARHQIKEALEDVRVSLLGYSFQCAVVAWFLLPSLRRDCCRPKDLTVAKMRGGDQGVLIAVMQRCNSEEIASFLARDHISSCDPCGSDVRIDVGEPFGLRSWPRQFVDVDRWTWRPDFPDPLAPKRHYHNVGSSRCPFCFFVYVARVSRIAFDFVFCCSSITRTSLPCLRSAAHA